jgi:hypothetical protein
MTEYKDITSNIYGQFNIYTKWDKYDRLWLNCDGEIYFWQKVADGWQKVKWGYTHNKLRAYPKSENLS